MPPFAALILLAAPPLPVDMDSLGVDRARHLSGRLVAASFVSVKPADFVVGRTVLGAADQFDGIARSAVLLGNHLGRVRDGKRVVVLGMLEVIDHKPRRIGVLEFEGWTEIRVSG